MNVPGDAATIQGGINLAGPGDTVLVGPATWQGVGNVNLSFGGVDLVLLSSGGRDVTTIDCGGTTRGLVFSSGESASAIVQGFTIRDGSSTTGGGIVIDEASPVIRDCRFVSCYAPNHGGAADIQATSAPLFEDCLFDSNSTIGIFHWGGAVQVLDDVSFVRCTFRDNVSGYAGGAIRIDGAGDVAFESCTFERNTGTDGGAVVDQSGFPTSFESCTFVENHATSTGGALLLGGARHTFTECLFDMNSCDLGGTMYVTLGDAVLLNCTVARTTSDSTSAAFVVVNSGADIDLTNTIIYGSLSGAAVQCLNYGDVTPVCSDLFGNAHGDWVGCVSGEGTLNGNFSDDPFFCDPDSGDFTLDAASPCLNAPGCGLVGAYGQGCNNNTSVAGSGAIPSGAFDLFVSPNPSVGRVSLCHCRWYKSSE